MSIINANGGDMWNGEKRLTGIGSSGSEVGIGGVGAAVGVNVRVDDIVGNVEMGSCSSV